MTPLIESVALCSVMAVPVLAIWAITCLYTSRAGCQCATTQCIYFTVLLAIAGLTVRTVMTDEGCWLIHTSSLGMLIVAGVMRKPVDSEAWGSQSAL